MRGTPNLAVCHCSERFLISRNLSLRSWSIVSNIKTEQKERAGLEPGGFNDGERAKEILSCFFFDFNELLVFLVSLAVWILNSVK